MSEPLTNETKMTEATDLSSKPSIDGKRRKKNTRGQLSFPVQEKASKSKTPSDNFVFEPETDESSFAGSFSFVAEELKQTYGENVEYVATTSPVETVISEMVQKSRTDLADSGFVLVDLGKVIQQAMRWKRALPRVQPFYAMKSNPSKNIVRTLHLLGVNFDCASKGEIELALEVGADPTQIIYANPAKGPDHIRYARDKDVRLMTFDNVAELEKIVAAFPDAEVVLRIASNDSLSLMPFGYKFGSSYEDALSLILSCKQLGAKLVGISFHVGSGCYSSIGFVDTLRVAKKLFIEAERVGLKLSLLDIGGGFPGDDSEGKITFEELTDAIRPVIDVLFPVDQVTVIAEPGRFFCTSSTTIAMPITAKREYMARRKNEESGEFIHVKETQYYVTDGVYGNFNNIIYDHATPVCKPLREPPLNAVMNNSTFFGPTCDSIDVLVKCVPFPSMTVGDWVYFPNMGAYTVAAGSCFNGFQRLQIVYQVSDYSS